MTDAAGGAAAERVRVERTVEAATEDEARTRVIPVVTAFRAAGWQLEEELWMPNTQGPRSDASLYLSAARDVPLSVPGTLRQVYTHPDPGAVPPSTAPAPRVIDTVGGTAGRSYHRFGSPRVTPGGVSKIGFVIVWLIVAFVILRVILGDLGPFGGEWSSITFEGQKMECNLETGKCRNR